MIFNKLFPTFSKVFSKKSVPPLVDNALIWRPWRLGYPGSMGIMTPYSQSVWVYAALNAIATNISQVPFRLYRSDKEVKDGSIFNLFDSPNPYMSFEQLIEMTIINLGLYGEAFWVLEGRDNITKIPTEIWTYNPTKFTPIMQNGNLFGWGYKNGTIELSFNTWEIIQFKFSNPYNPLRGLSPLDAIKVNIDQEYFANEFNKAFFQNGATVGGFISSEKTMTDEQFKRLTMQFEKRHKGVDRSHKIGILEGGMKYIPMRYTQKEMDFIELKKMSREEIFGAYKVNSVVLGLYEDVKSYEGIKTAHKTFWQECLIPKIKLIENKLWHGLFKDIDKGLTSCRFDLSEVSSLQEDFDSKVKNAQILAQMGVPLDEINRRLGLGLDDQALPETPIVPIEMGYGLNSKFPFFKRGGRLQPDGVSCFWKKETINKTTRHILDVYLDKLYDEYNSDWLFKPILRLFSDPDKTLKDFGDELISLYGNYDKKYPQLLAKAFTASYLAGMYEVMQHSKNKKSIMQTRGSADYTDLPFDEAIQFFKEKIPMQSQAWSDLLREQHSKAFVVAGAADSDLLADLKGSIEKGLAEGTTLNDFRKDFDKIVADHGWSYRGERGWRTDVMFNTNISVAYSAGRYKQLQDTVETFPIWQYKTAGDTRVRDEHAAWDDVTLKADDPWWNSHYPPCGWGCRCYVISFMEHEVPLKNAPEEGTYDWVNPNTGKTEKIPVGIDPGWNYNVGKAAWGEKLSKDAMDAWDAEGSKAWQRLTDTDYKTFGKSEYISKVKNDIELPDDFKTTAKVKDYLVDLLDGEEKVFNFKKRDFNYSILVNADELSSHLDLERSRYLAYLPDTLNDPQEVWLSFEQHKGTGKVRLRERIIKGFEMEGEKDKDIILVFQAKNGMMESLTMIPTSKENYINKQRVGYLIYDKDN